MTRTVLLITNVTRSELRHHTCEIAALFTRAGMKVAMSPAELDVIGRNTNPLIVAADPDSPAESAELVCVLGGDGTILRAADIARGSGIPLLGVNFGHVGFLAQAERDALTDVVRHVVTGDYSVEERMTLDVTALHRQDVIATSWALNEVTVEKAARERMLELVLEIDGRPLSTWGCDGVIVATPTGSTAYAFSAGGPVVWPDVEALLLVPISAHALFARPLVVGPDSHVAVDLVAGTEGQGVMWCDGSRPVELPEAARVEVRRSDLPVRLARLDNAPFTDRLVEKFALSVHGWRGRNSTTRR
ncbi:NAD+ kinase [Austwickia chelonae]|uniref:NAD kinase n=1 Tax=Austwickia chelonae NBRC 105200 TaxID=1184607 RepID=K6V665_9MICO|nr:NAD kinase [Austwickia chelonae]GAB77723.1 putative inorganic polyphosphate/ATP-NAD kinase [Austwickia chelonae NBRC 105200]SEW16573.1 NAD+ kinase [Austwickia chelonae]